MASVKETQTPGTWTIYLDDVTQDWYFEQNFTYHGPGISAEWIEEAPTVSGSLSALANFGSVNFAETSVFGDLGPNGTTWYGTDLGNANEIDMVNSAKTLQLAAPSAPTADPTVGQDFTDTYENTSIEVPVVTITQPSDDAQASTKIDVHFSATDSTSAIASYSVRYYVDRWNVSYQSADQYPPAWQATSASDVSLNVAPGSQYCFSVQATSDVGIASPWSRDACAVVPLGEASLATVGTGRWSRHHSVTSYLDSFVTTTSIGATLRLSGAWASQVAVVASRCPSGGLVDVYINGRLLGKINTYGKRMEPNLVFDLPAFRFGRVSVELVSASSHRRVIIEGLGID